jgi:hypothetical protein
VRAGALADLIVVDGNPLQDITLLTGQGEHLSLVMQSGTSTAAADRRHGAFTVAVFRTPSEKLRRACFSLYHLDLDETSSRSADHAYIATSPLPSLIAFEAAMRHGSFTRAALNCISRKRHQPPDCPAGALPRQEAVPARAARTAPDGQRPALWRWCSACWSIVPKPPKTS